MHPLCSRPPRPPRHLREVAAAGERAMQRARGASHGGDCGQDQGTILFRPWVATLLFFST
ncbi:unnamed protein product [Ectocarpus sp. CCAP 1310/34]|nr:unnamed protein product [Ectocarpus sp. CCAP 1310/34]